MTSERVLIRGIVTAPASATTCELTLDVAQNGLPSTWVVFLSTAQAEAEACGLGVGEAVAFVGVCGRAAVVGDLGPRRLMAERAISLHPAAVAVLDAQPLTVNEAWAAALDRLERLAIVAGAFGERARIRAILDSAEAEGRLALAWRLAEAGLTADAARDGLLIAKHGDAPAIESLSTLKH